MTELTPISAQIWDMKYRLKTADREPRDSTVEDTWRRVARALAEPEAEQRERWEEAFYDALRDFRFLPAGRVLAGVGSGHAVTLFNCFVMGRIPDDLGGIFDALTESALTLQQGGGIGCDFSTLRPRGTWLRRTGATSSGPLPFMDVWDAMCRTIMSAGHRRGAMMATMRCDHPDIEEFVEAKRDPARLRNFNLSVLVTDAFVEAVKADRPWDLAFEGAVFRTVRARELWDKITRATYDVAEPGVVFIDRVNRLNPLAYIEDIYATNPCGEQPLPPYGACLLGSINLARLVRDPFTAGAALDEDELERLTRIAVRMLDNAIVVSHYPLPRQAEEARAKRRMGLGVTGLADALILCGVRYGSERSLELTAHWLRRLRDAAYRASAELAAEKGPFPAFDRERHLATEAARLLLDDELRAEIAAKGLRNALLTSIAPTGTISLFADNVSSGIEPVFSFRYRRNVLMPDGSRRTEEVQDYAYRRFRELKGADAPLPDAFVDVETLTPADHLAIQAVAQRYVDSSISKTINCPADIAFGDFKDVYLRAYDLGCKGCTTYRPNEVTGAVLERGEDKSLAVAPVAPGEAPPEADEERRPAAAGAVDGGDGGGGGVVHLSPPLERPERLSGTTYKLRWPESDHATYVTINDIVQDGRRRPFEIFINSKNMEHYAWTVALTRMISAVFRRGGDISFVVEELKAVFDPRGGAWMGGRYVPSIIAAIGGVIERHLIDIGFLPSPEQSGAEDAEGAAPRRAATEGGTRLRGCPRCHQPSLIRLEGCDTCLTCGYSRCA